MLKCRKCKLAFSYKKVFKAIWNLNGLSTLKCKECNSLYKITPLSRWIIAILIALPAGLTYLKPNFLIEYILYLTVLIILSPFIVRFN